VGFSVKGLADCSVCFHDIKTHCNVHKKNKTFARKTSWRGGVLAWHGISHSFASPPESTADRTAPPSVLSSIRPVETLLRFTEKNILIGVRG
jgi:hypothetical protein